MGPHHVTVKLVSRAEMGRVVAELDENYKDPPWGLCDYTNFTIYVQRVSKTHPKVQQVHTFWHEYFHMLFHIAGRFRLSRDEGLVDLCGALHLQMLNTAE